MITINYIKKIIKEELDEVRLSDVLKVSGDKNDLHNYIQKEKQKDFIIDRELPVELTLQSRFNNKKIKVFLKWNDSLTHNLKKRIKDRTSLKSIGEFVELYKVVINKILPKELGVNINENDIYGVNILDSGVTLIISINLDDLNKNQITLNTLTILPKGDVNKKNIRYFFVV